MPTDMTMCSGIDCPIKETCIRFTGEAYGRVVSFTRIPYDHMRGNCDYFVWNKPDPLKVNERAYWLWLQAGKPKGRDLDFWLKAENELTPR